MRRFLMLLLMTGAAFAQTTQTYTGTIKDLTQQPVTSGQVTFTLTLANASTIPGVGTFVPTTTLCNINSDGTLSGYVAGAVSGACIVTANISLTPTGTAYRICEQPYYSTPGSCFYDYALGGSKDISSIVPTLQTGPLDYSAVGPAGPAGPIGATGPAGTLGSGTVGTLGGSHSGGTSTISGISINGTVTPDAYGLYSGNNLTTTTGTAGASSTSLAVASSNTFSQYHDLFVAHGGVACGIARGTICPTGLAPTITQGGAAGSTSYSYQTRCIDGLGGAGSAGSTATTATGNAALSTVNYNVLTFTVTAGCIELAIYRGGSLIGRRYAINSNNGTSVAFYDYGQSVVALRDIPAAANATVYADNYVGQITAISGTTWTVTPAITTAVSGATVMHSDTPMLQAAYQAGNVVGQHYYLLNYPLNFIGGGGAHSFGVNCDTGDVCIDATDQQSVTFNSVLLFTGPTAPSSIGLYLARDSARTSQNFASNQFLANMTSVPSAGTGQELSEGKVVPVGAIGFYNYGAEIENHNGMTLNGEDRPIELTGTNIYNVPSLFDASQVTTPTSMSQITFTQMTCGTGTGPFVGLDYAFTINFIGGYCFGGDSDTYPWGFDVTNNNADFRLYGFRQEGRDGLMHLFPGAQLGDSDFMLSNFGDRSPTVSQFQFDAGSFLQKSVIFADYLPSGAWGQTFYTCATTGCLGYNPLIFVGINQSFNTSPTAESNNHVFLNTSSNPVELLPSISTPAVTAIDTSTTSVQAVTACNANGTGACLNILATGSASPVGSWPNHSTVLESSINAGSSAGTLVIDANGPGSTGIYQVNRVSVAGWDVNGLISAGNRVTVTSGTPSVGQASCIKAAGPPVVIGYCSTVVGAGGACTCN